MRTILQLVIGLFCCLVEAACAQEPKQVSEPVAAGRYTGVMVPDGNPPGVPSGQMVSVEVDGEGRIHLHGGVGPPPVLAWDRDRAAWIGAGPGSLNFEVYGVLFGELLRLKFTAVSGNERISGFYYLAKEVSALSE